MKLVRIGTVYNLRRWVPLDVRQIIGKNELWHSLETSDKELAKNRACAIFSLTSDFFASVKTVKSYLYEPATELADSLDIRDDFVKNAISKIIESYELQIKEMRTQFKLQQAEHYMERMEDYQRLKNLTEMVEKSKPKLNAVLSYMKDSKDFDAYTSIKTMQQQFEQVQTWVKPPEKRKSPTLSKALEAYLNGQESKLTDSDRRGIINTVKRFIEVCEDKEIRDYTGEDAGKFREIMEKMPENYGKSRNDTRTVFELVEHAKKNNLGNISEKTIKNHFARLSSIWNYYLLRDLTDRNIFIGWKFDQKYKVRRIRWNDEQLQTLISSDWNSPTISRKTFGFIVGLGSYAGMRLEEICRIRIQDIIEIRGIPCIFIRDHEARKNRPWEKWSPKTEAGEHVVPISEALINSGFLRFIEQQKNKKQYYLFSELRFSGKDKKRSDGFQQSFSRFKLRKKIPKGVDFHSFRHNVSTKLRNLPDGINGLRESWIDDFLGHEGQNKSVGNVVYLDMIDVENLKKVADSVLYPDFWNIKNLIEKNNV